MIKIFHYLGKHFTNQRKELKTIKYHINIERSVTIVCKKVAKDSNINFLGDNISNFSRAPL